MAGYAVTQEDPSVWVSKRLRETAGDATAPSWLRAAAKVPDSIRKEYWKEFDKMKAVLSKK